MNKEEQNSNSRNIIAVILIVIGVIWLFKRLLLLLPVPHFHFNHIFYSLQHSFPLGNFLFSWQVIIIIAGLILLSGNRKFGLVLIIFGGLFLISKIFYPIPLSIMPLLIPIFIIVLGIILIFNNK